MQDLGTGLKHIIICTDNAPYQYHCCQNVVHVVFVKERHAGIEITHQLAVVDNVKGIHDAI